RLRPGARGRRRLRALDAARARGAGGGARHGRHRGAPRGALPLLVAGRDGRARARARERACRAGGQPGRRARALRGAHDPGGGAARARVGAVRAAPATLRRLLVRGGAVIACPESNHPKPFRARYRLGRFGRGAFARVAIATGAPIVPVAVIGAEEVHPVLARLDLPGRLLGLPTLPVTPTFPWLGLWGLVPLPTKWTLLFGEPLDVAARHGASDASQPARVARLRDQRSEEHTLNSSHYQPSRM